MLILKETHSNEREKKKKIKKGENTVNGIPRTTKLIESIRLSFPRDFSNCDKRTLSSLVFDP